MNDNPVSCVHFPDCGGCQYLDLAPEAEEEKKRAMMLHALHAQGLEGEIADFERSPLYSRRRASFSAKRTKKSAILGFTQSRTHQIVDMNACLVLLPEILALKPALLEMTQMLASRSATLKFSVTSLAHGFDLSIENAKPVEPQTLPLLSQICQGAQIHRLDVNGELAFMSEEPWVEIGGFAIAIPPSPFLQATKHGEEALRSRAHAALAGKTHIADLFSGLGTFSYGLLMRVDAYEFDARSCEFMQKNLNRHGLHNIKIHRADLFREPLTPDQLAPYDALILDPPRAGARAQCEEIAKSAVPRIIYISCDPQSFARDAKILSAGGYQMGGVTLIDQFRFSSHIESFTVFEKSI